MLPVSPALCNGFLRVHLTNNGAFWTILLGVATNVDKSRLKALVGCSSMLLYIT